MTTTTVATKPATAWGVFAGSHPAHAGIPVRGMATKPRVYLPDASTARRRRPRHRQRRWGPKIFTLTGAGHAVNDGYETAPPWEVLAGARNFVDMRRAVKSVIAASKQVAQVGSKDQVAAAAEILADARQRLYQLLAE